MGSLLSHTLCRDFTICGSLSIHILRTIKAVVLWIIYFVLTQVSNQSPVAILWYHWSPSFWDSSLSCRQARSLLSQACYSLSQNRPTPRGAETTLTGGTWTHRLSCLWLNFSHSTVRFVRCFDHPVYLLVLAERDRTNKWLLNCCEWRLKLGSHHLWDGRPWENTNLTHMYYRLGTEAPKS